MEDWQIEAVRALLDGNFLEPDGTLVEIDELSFYTHSNYFGAGRRHIVIQDYNGEIILSQLEPSERYQQKVTLHGEEFEPLLKMLLRWHFAHVERRRAAEAEGVKGDGLGDLDDHPF